ncbi:9681_t:CDS:1, partial [Ambispora gerdemannii]
SLLSQQKRFKVYFDVYMQLISQPIIPATSLSNEHGPSSAAQRILQYPVFISLVLGNCPKDCIHGFFNITPNHAIFESLKNSLTKNRQQIAYFCCVV